MKFRIGIICVSLLVSFFNLSANVPYDYQLINMGIYKSYFSQSLHEPLYVVYWLHYGGGECDRYGYRFSTCGQEGTAIDNDYYGVGYDRGHLANAEDFSSNCDEMKNTFCYFNCLPQTSRLNRGIWRVWESKLRELSRTEELMIVSGGIFKGRTLPSGNSIAIPDQCYKIVYQMPEKTLLFCLLFNNDATGKVEKVSYETLSGMLGYHLSY
jgi:endonuclease G